jgi:hypothetical protein
MLAGLTVRQSILGRTWSKARVLSGQKEHQCNLALSVSQQFRADGLVTWSEKRIAIEDRAQLQEVAEFDPTFLNLDNEPR